jgi:hypothetical protein
MPIVYYFIADKTRSMDAIGEREREREREREAVPESLA